MNWVITETCAWGGHLLSQKQKSEETCLLKETNEVTCRKSKWEQMTWERERNWEYVYFPMTTIFCLIPFLQSSKTIPTPAYPWCNSSIFLPSNLQIFWHLDPSLLSFFLSYQKPFLYLWVKLLPLFLGVSFLQLFPSCCSSSNSWLSPICINMLHPNI